MNIYDLRYGSVWEYKGSERLMVIGPAPNRQFVRYVALTSLGTQRPGTTSEVALSALIGDRAVWKLLETA